MDEYPKDQNASLTQPRNDNNIRHPAIGMLNGQRRGKLSMHTSNKVTAKKNQKETVKQQVNYL